MPSPLPGKIKASEDRASDDQILIPISVRICKQIGRAQTDLSGNRVGAGGRKASLAISMEDIQEISRNHKIEIPVIGESNGGHPLRKLLLGQVGGHRQRRALAERSAVAPEENLHRSKKGVRGGHLQERKIGDSVTIKVAGSEAVEGSYRLCRRRLQRAVPVPGENGNRGIRRLGPRCRQRCR